MQYVMVVEVPDGDDDESFADDSIDVVARYLQDELDNAAVELDARDKSVFRVRPLSEVLAC
jgi:hypothetical protein